ncbi:MAG: sugar ABC transporter permease [Lachnospiraceae bacterium]|nr:sugar ABC transporter permease [Lachnospiraceae bacterium]
MSRRQKQSNRKLQSFRRTRRVGRIMMTPTMLFFALMTIYPLIFMVFYSFTDFRLLSRSYSFVAFSNYVELLRNEYFRSSVWISVVFTVISVATELVLGLACALYVNSLRSKTVQGILRILLLVPYLLPTVTVAVSWRMMLSANFGIINKWFSFWGIPVYNWLSDIKTAFGTLIAVEIWQNTPFVFLVLYVALQAIPEEQFEAIAVFGARPLDYFLLVLLPNLRPSILFCLLIRSIDCIRIFDKVNLLTGGGPANSTTTISQFVYHYGIRNLRFGYGCAACMVLIFAVLVITHIYLCRRERLRIQQGETQQNA